MLKKQMITEELFNKIREILRGKGKLPDILDYGLAAHNPVLIRTYEFDLKSNLTYGGNEGIYLSLWIEYFVNNERRKNGISTFKTLDESNEAMHIMADVMTVYDVGDGERLDTVYIMELDDGGTVYAYESDGNSVGKVSDYGVSEKELISFVLHHMDDHKKP